MNRELLLIKDSLHRHLMSALNIPTFSILPILSVTVPDVSSPHALLTFLPSIEWPSLPFSCFSLKLLYGRTILCLAFLVIITANMSVPRDLQERVPLIYPAQLTHEHTLIVLQ